MDITRKLKDLLDRSGLTDEEVRFYLAVLKRPGSTIYDLSKVAGVPKDRAYKLSESLTEKKLINAAKEGQLKKLSAASLQGYIDGLKSDGRRLHRTADSLKEINPFLHFMGAPEEDSCIRTFSHEEAGEAFVDLSTMKWNDVLAYGDFDQILTAITPDSDRKFVSNRLKHGGKAFPVIANPGEYSWNHVIKNDMRELRQSKVLYNEKLSNYFVCLFPDMDTTAFWVKGKDGKVSGSVVESASLTKLHENIYDHFNDISEPHNFRKTEKKEM
jgi:sugar-specific transcriptional regulator TrmB